MRELGILLVAGALAGFALPVLLATGMGITRFLEEWQGVGLGAGLLAVPAGYIGGMQVAHAGSPWGDLLVAGTLVLGYLVTLPLLVAAGGGRYGGTRASVLWLFGCAYPVATLIAVLLLLPG